MLYAIIMAGGSGTRFWPKSRRDRPKQLLRLAGETTMLQQTVARIEPLVPRDRILIVTGADQAAATRAQLPDLPAENVIAEPSPRDTAPCVGLAAGIVAQRDPGRDDDRHARRSRDRARRGVPHDGPGGGLGHRGRPDRARHLRHQAHSPRDRLRLHRARRAAGNPRRNPRLPSRSVPRKARPRHGRTLPGRRQLRLELGDLRVACAGRSWTRCGRIARNWPTALEPILESLGTPDEAETLARLFPRLERVPIDKAVMEHAPNVRVLEVPYRWNDVGDWRALASLLEHDAAGNAIQGDVIARDTTNSIIISDDGGLVATLGVDDLVVVHSGKATLVARKDQLDKLKALVEGLGEAGYGSYL